MSEPRTTVATRQKTLPGVLCLEGEWEADPRHPLSIEPALRLLESNEYINLVHRNVNTKAELAFHLSRMTYRRKPLYDLLYLAFHGDKTGLEIGDEELSIAELASVLGEDRAAGQVVYLASCSALGGSTEMLMDFCKRTNARAIAGYTRTVDWIESSAFELLMISRLTHAANLKPLHNNLVKQHPHLTSRLGFRMATSKWVTEVGS